METYRDWRESALDRVETGEIELLRLGRQCMRTGRTTEAETVYQAAAYFPDWYSVLLQLAGCYLAQGQRDKAIDTMEQVLARKPSLHGYIKRAIRAQIAAAGAAAKKQS